MAYHGYLVFNNSSYFMAKPRVAQVSAEWTVDMNDFYLAVPLREVPNKSPAVGRAVARSSWSEFDGILQRRTWAANWMRN